MKFRLPPGCLGVSLAGTPVAVAADGTVEADPHQAAALAAHGIVSLPEAEAREASRKPKDKKA